MPHPGNSAWVRQRLDAVIALYRPTPAGAALLRSLDLRQMLGEPGFFGSYGFDSWAGVGEPRPIGEMHELMHFAPPSGANAAEPPSTRGLAAPRQGIQ